MVTEQENVWKQENKNLLNTSASFKTSKHLPNPPPKPKKQTTKTTTTPKLARGCKSMCGVGFRNLHRCCRALLWEQDWVSPNHVASKLHVCNLLGVLLS